MMHPTAGTLCVLSLALVLATGSAKGGEEVEEIDVFANLSVPAMLRGHLSTLVKQGMPITIEVKARDAERAPAKGVKLLLRWEDGEKELTADDAGVARFQLSPEMLPRPVLVVPAGHRVSLTTPTIKVSTHTGSGAGGADAETLDIDSLERLRHDGLEVYYPEGHEEVALDALQFLARVRGFVDGKLDLRLESPFGIALHDRTAPSISVVGRTVFPVPIPSWKSEGGPFSMPHWVQIHEWVELTLVSPGLYLEDPNARFVGDGIAELLSFEYCRRHHANEVPGRLSQYVDRVSRLLESGKKTYDLAADFRAHVSTRTVTGADLSDWKSSRLKKGFRPGLNEVGGYPLSFLFWHRIHGAGGDEALRRVVRFLVRKENPDRNAAGVLAEVEAATGGKPSTTIDLAVALEELKALHANHGK